LKLTSFSFIVVTVSTIRPSFSCTAQGRE
jgi:hypothetical protein